MATAEQLLSTLFRRLAAGEQATLLAFAEFLAGRNPSSAASVNTVPAVIQEPEKIDRAAGESVVGGLKRLAKTYPMLDKQEMLKATSDLVASSLMLGTDPVEVIDKLEIIFREHYEQLKSGRK